MGKVVIPTRQPGAEVQVRDQRCDTHRLGSDRTVRRWNHQCEAFEIIDASRTVLGDIVSTLGDEPICGEVIG